MRLEEGKRQLLEKGEEISSLKATLEAKKASLSGSKSSLAEARASVDTLRGEMSGLQAQLSSQSAEIVTLKHKLEEAEKAVDVPPPPPPLPAYGFGYAAPSPLQQYSAMLHSGNPAGSQVSVTPCAHRPRILLVPSVRSAV